MAALERDRTWEEATGQWLAYAPDGRAWACGSRAQLQVFEEDALARDAGVAGVVLGEPRFSADGARVLAAPLAFDRATATWSSAHAAQAALTTGLAPDAAAGYAVAGGAWSSAGDALAVHGRYRPPRGVPHRAPAAAPAARLVLLEDDRPVVLWEGRATEPVDAVLVAPGFVAWGGRTVDVRERPTARPVANLRGGEAVARRLRLDPGGARMAAATADGQVVVWDAGSWRELARWSAHDGEAAALEWHPGGDALATGGADEAVRLWSPSGERLAGLELGEPVTGLAFDPGGTRLLAAPAGLDGGVAALAVRA